MVEHVSHYSWLGYRANGFGFNITFITLHPEYKKLGNTPDARQQVCRALFRG